MNGATAAEGALPDLAHPRGHHHHGHEASRRALGTALGLTLSFLVVEVVVGLWSGSLALLADAGHMVNDAAALALSLFVSWIATRPRDRKLTFGYRRAEVMGALINGVALGVAGVWIVIEAVQRLQSPTEVRGLGMLLAAAAGLVINLVSAWVLSRSSRHSINVQAALFHVLSDALGSLAAVFAGVAILAFGWYLADPIASLAISLLILVGAWRLIAHTTRLLMQGAPPWLDVEAVEATIQETAGVSLLADLHVWELVPGEAILSAHVVLEAGAEAMEVAETVEQRLAHRHQVRHATIQPRRPDQLPELDCGTPAAP
ncbi:MAG: cation diffusion facilitator family transporter [Sandaracinaceae bacterium]